MIYFDHNATTPLDEAVCEAMQPFLGAFYANPSSLYRAGRVARSAINTAREQVAALVSVQPSQVIFTSGGTEANNLALKGIAGLKKMAVAAFEHPSVLETAQSLQRQGAIVDTIAIQANGLIDCESFKRVVDNGAELISVMLANNETGAVQDIARLAASLRQANVIFHTDAVQALGKIPIDFNRIGVQLMTLSGHKIYGPKGCGALVIDSKIPLQPVICGGGQENGLRGGTENVAAIVGFGKAAELAEAELRRRSDHLLRLTQQLQSGLRQIAGLELFGNGVARLPNTVQFGIPGTDGEMLLMQLDGKGFAVSSGSACASGGGQPSHVLMAMGVDSALAKSAIRVSLGQANTEEEIEHFITTLKTLVQSPYQR